MLSLPCLSELVSALAQTPSAAQQVPLQEQQLLIHVADALAVCGGMKAAALAAAEAAGDAAAAAKAHAVKDVPAGYKSPGLLHMLLGTHVRLLVERSSEQCPPPAAHTRAVNVLRLVKALLQRPGLVTPYAQQLLLPCLLRPLLRPLAAQPTGCPAVLMEAYQLLYGVLVATGPDLLPPLGRAAAAPSRAVSFR